MSFKTISKSFQQRSAKILLVGAGIIATNLLYAFTPPTFVVDSFHNRYPDVKSMSWYKTGIYEREYGVKFKSNGEKLIGFFDSNGFFVETEKSSNVKKLPKTVIATLDIQFSSYKILEVLEVNKNDGLSIYDIRIKSFGNTTDIALSEEGYIVVR